MIHAVLLVGVLGSFAVVGVQQYRRRRLQDGCSVLEVQEASRKDKLQAHAILDLDAELELDSPESGAFCMKEQPPPVFFYALVKPKQMAPIPEEPELELDLGCIDKTASTATKQLSPLSFERLYENLWSGLKKPNAESVS